MSSCKLCENYPEINRYTETELKLAKAIEALELIAAPKRSDGTYNRDRTACGELARDTLADILDIRKLK